MLLKKAKIKYLCRIKSQALMKRKILAFIIGAAALAACHQTQEKSTQKENYYETMEAT